MENPRVLSLLPKRQTKEVYNAGQDNWNRAKMRQEKWDRSRNLWY